MSVPLDRMRPGDLLLFKGNGLFGFLISKATLSDYTHAAMYVGDGFLAQMLLAGGNECLVSDEVRQNPGRWSWRPVRDEFRTWYAGERASLLARQFAGHPYAKQDIIRYAAYHMPVIRCFLRHRGTEVTLDEALAHPAYCSMMVHYAAMFGGGIDPVQGEVGSMTPPADLDKSLLWDKRKEVIL